MEIRINLHSDLPHYGDPVITQTITVPIEHDLTTDVCTMTVTLEFLKDLVALAKKHGVDVDLK